VNSSALVFANARVASSALEARCHHIQVANTALKATQISDHTAASRMDTL
jgi:hypothetical protein